ncbi:tripartite tricarboxylate transporter substrate binding protein [Roseomonas sp. OT10]|uniref:Bug family tripartite tricarboxylate transporter substrate binding protein n=1 Tax=Roseomonas cutis TaxID=2897332 RepID=UPI001E60BF6F|nr:tripartite tricarboxylate transporter substrate binding protein [Roseomonas sp. OT10]UFN47357.1 tripartite tricarboxylate transporter substrate binding protein [Roseomonas sp. OT10]
MLTRRALSLLPILATLPSPSQAQDFPTHPGRVVIPFAPGAATDILARLMAAQLGEALGQPFVAENRTGANGAIGAELVARAPKDGHTLLMGTFSTHATNPQIYANTPYDPVRDFAPVTLVATVPMVLAVNPATGLRDVAGLIDAARRRPGMLTSATGGLGSSQHLSAVLFERAAGVRLDIIHYARGFATVIPDLLENRVNMTFGDPLSLLPTIREGKLRALAVTSAQRTEMLPEVPTMAEAGLPGAAAVTWYGLFVTGGTPQPIVDRLGQVAGEAVRKPAVTARIRELGAVPSGIPPAEFAAFVRSELERWGAVIRDAGIRVE